MWTCYECADTQLINEILVIQKISAAFISDFLDWSSFTPFVGKEITVQKS